MERYFLRPRAEDVRQRERERNGERRDRIGVESGGEKKGARGEKERGKVEERDGGWGERERDQHLNDLDPRGPTVFTQSQSPAPCVPGHGTNSPCPEGQLQPLADNKHSAKADHQHVHNVQLAQ